MSKFKVGDKVRILDGSKIKNYACGWVKSMGWFVGKVETISGIEEFSNGVVGYKLHNTLGFTFDERGLEPYQNETIVVYRKDNEVIALDKRTGKKAIAKCSPEDTFDFNIGAKLAFDRLMNGNKESITVEVMRKRLKSYCAGRSCCNCKLKGKTYRCGRGTNFTIKDDAGNYTMSDEEIKTAFNVVFGNGVKEDNPKEPHKFKVGERYRVSIGIEKGNTIEITETKRDRVFYKIISGKPGVTGNNFDRKSLFAESLVLITQKVSEETPKLYNGKIIFTKGDGMFKTGHIYEVKGGRINTVEYGQLPMHESLKDIEDVKDYFTGSLDGNRKRKKGWSPYTLELMEVKED